MNKSRLLSSPVGLKLGFLAALAFLISTSGCGTTIGLSSDRYMPKLDTAPLAKYSGKAIVMHNFENADNDTSFYLYHGQGRRYGGPVLTSYFWYCFKSTFTKLGVNVLDEAQAPTGTPALDVRLTHINEAGFTVVATVSGATGQPPLQKEYSISGPPIADPKDQAALESRAYSMMTALFGAMVSDPQFQAVVAP